MVPEVGMAVLGVSVSVLVMDFFASFLEVLCGGSKGFGVGWGLHVLSFLPLGILPGLIACGHLAARCSCYV